MPDKVYIGPNKVGSFVKKGEYEPVTRVTMWYDDDDDHYFTAGDDTGREMRLNNPYATQVMVENVLEALKGKIYRPFEARDVVWDPTIELGDGINIGGIYSMLGHVDMKFGPEIIANISCPGGNVIDNELPYIDPDKLELKRRVKLEQKYFGTKISRREGLVIENVDEKTNEVLATAVLNAKMLAFFKGQSRKEEDAQLYFDTDAGCYKFRGALNVNNNFVVDKDGNVTINGSLTMTGTSNWLMTRYSTNRNAPVPIGWTEAWDAKWDNTSTQVWAIYSYNGGAMWTTPMLAQGRDGERGPQGSEANIPGWVKAYTASAEFDTKVTDEWVVAMNLYGSKIFGGEFFDLNKMGRLRLANSGGNISDLIYENVDSGQELFSVKDMHGSATLYLYGVPIITANKFGGNHAAILSDVTVQATFA